MKIKSILAATALACAARYASTSEDGANGLPDTKFGTFPQSLMDEAKEKDWVVISMKNDWSAIFSNK